MALRVIAADIGSQREDKALKDLCKAAQQRKAWTDSNGKKLSDSWGPSCNILKEPICLAMSNNCNDSALHCCATRCSSHGEPHIFTVPCNVLRICSHRARPEQSATQQKENGAELMNTSDSLCSCLFACMFQVSEEMWRAMAGRLQAHRIS